MSNLIISDTPLVQQEHSDELGTLVGEKVDKSYQVYVVITEQNHVTGFECVGSDNLARLVREWYTLEYPITKKDTVINPVGWDSYVVTDKEFFQCMLSTFTSIGFTRAKEFFSLINSEYAVINLLVVT